MLGSKGVASEMGMVAPPLYTKRLGYRTLSGTPGAKHAKASEAESAFAVVDRNHFPTGLPLDVHNCPLK